MLDLLLNLLRGLRLSRYVVIYPRRMVAGRRMKIPIFLEVGLLHLNDREPWMDEVLRPLLGMRKGLFVDVGANVGQTLLRVSAIEPGRTYLGFEPNPVAVAYVEELARVNRLGAFRLVPAGLGDRDGLADLAIYSLDPSDGTASLVPEFRLGVRILQRKTVAVYRFDDLPRFFPIEKLGVVKIDVEGGELDVLTGMREHLRRDRPPVLFELLPIYRDSNVHRIARQSAIEAFLEELDYSIHRIHGTHRPLRLETITGPIGIHGELDWSNYLAVPREEAEALLGAFQR